MLSRLELKNIGPANSLVQNFAPRINLLTGDNGLGKSLLLDAAWWVCARDWPDEPVLPRSFVTTAEPAEIGATIQGIRGQLTSASFRFDPDYLIWKRNGGSRPPKPGLVVYARIDGGFSLWDPAQHYFRVAPSLAIDEPDRAPAIHLSKHEVWDGKQVEGTDGRPLRVCDGLLRDWLFWEDRRPGLFKVFVKVLECLSPAAEKLVPASPVTLPSSGVTPIPSLMMSYGVVPLPHASAAVRRVVTLAYLLVWSWFQHEELSRRKGLEPEKRLILIIDEIEAHLHPFWQRLILPALLDAATILSDKIKVQLIVSTHSPLVLASLEPDFDQKQDKLFHLDLRADGGVDLLERPWVKRGDAGNWLRSDMFQLGEARSKPAEDAILAAEALMAERPSPVATLATPEEIEDALRSHLASIDPIWARWSLFRRNVT